MESKLFWQSWLPLMSDQTSCCQPTDSTAVCSFNSNKPWLWWLEATPQNRIGAMSMCLHHIKDGCWQRPHPKLLPWSSSLFSPALAWIKLNKSGEPRLVLSKQMPLSWVLITRTKGKFCVQSRCGWLEGLSSCPKTNTCSDRQRMTTHVWSDILLSTNRQHSCVLFVKTRKQQCQWWVTHFAALLSSATAS